MRHRAGHRAPAPAGPAKSCTGSPTGLLRAAASAEAQPGKLVLGGHRSPTLPQGLGGERGLRKASRDGEGAAGTCAGPPEPRRLRARHGREQEAPLG